MPVEQTKRLSWSLGLLSASVEALGYPGDCTLVDSGGPWSSSRSASRAAARSSRVREDCRASSSPEGQEKCLNYFGTLAPKVKAVLVDFTPKCGGRRPNAPANTVFVRLGPDSGLGFGDRAL